MPNFDGKKNIQSCKWLFLDIVHYPYSAVLIKHGPPWNDIYPLMQERRKSIANALELRLSCINTSILPRP